VWEREKGRRGGKTQKGEWVEGWKDGGVEGWRGGRMEGRDRGME